MTHPHRKHCAFTLIELVVSLAITSIVLLGSAGVIALSAQALPVASEPASVASHVLAAAESINADASTAIVIVPDRLAMILPDADADGNEEIVQYEIRSGKLARSYNRGDWIILVHDVSRCSLTVDDATHPVVVSFELETISGRTYSTSITALNLDVSP